METVISIVIFIVIVVPFSQFVHEFGHAIAARSLSANTVHIHIGKGKLIKQWYIIGIQCFLYSRIWGHAHTSSERRIEFTKGEKIIISIVGPLCNAWIAIVLFITEVYVYSHFIIQLAIAFNFWLFVINCIPFKIGQKQSDGYTIYKMMKQ